MSPRAIRAFILFATIIGLMCWKLLAVAPDPTFNYHGPNSFWGPIILKLLLAGAAALLLLGVGPVAVYRFVVERGEGPSVGSVVITAVAVFSCALALASPLCGVLLPGATVATRSAVATVLTALTFAVILPHTVARIGAIAVGAIAVGAIAWSVVTGARPDAGGDPLALQRAVEAGSVPGARLLLAAGHNPNTPVRVLASARGLPMVQLLLAHGADPNAGAHGQTPLSHACIDDDVDAVIALLDAGANVDDKHALRNASYQERGASLRVLLSRGADAGAPDLLRTLVAAAPFDDDLLKLETAVLAQLSTPSRAEERKDALSVAIWSNNLDAVWLLLPTVADACSDGRIFDIAKRMNPALLPQLEAWCAAHPQ